MPESLLSATGRGQAGLPTPLSGEACNHRVPRSHPRLLQPQTPALASERLPRGHSRVLTPPLRLPTCLMLPRPAWLLLPQLPHLPLWAPCFSISSFCSWFSSFSPKVAPPGTNRGPLDPFFPDDSHTPLLLLLPRLADTSISSQT